MVDGPKSLNESNIEEPVDAVSAESIKRNDKGRLSKQSKKPHRISRSAIIALILLVIFVIGSYLSWPIVRTLVLEQMQTKSAHTATAIRKLDLRMAQLEVTGRRYERAISSIKDTQEAFSKRLEILVKALPNSETFINLRRKLTTMEVTIANLKQQSSSSSYETLEQEVENLRALYTGLVNQPNQINFSDAAKQHTALAAKNAQLIETLSTLQTRLLLLENSLKQDVLARKSTGLEQSLIVAVSQLRQTVMSGRSYAEALDAVAALSKKNNNFAEAISTLTPTKKYGIVTLRALADQFPALARAVIKTEKKKSDEFLERTWQRVSSLVTIRRIGEIDGTETDAILARAERRLMAGELAAAINVMENLKEPANAAAQVWLDQAKTHLSAVLVLADMQKQAIANLADN